NSSRPATRSRWPRRAARRSPRSSNATCAAATVTPATTAPEGAATPRPSVHEQVEHDDDDADERRDEPAEQARPDGAPPLRERLVAEQPEHEHRDPERPVVGVRDDMKGSQYEHDRG